MSERVIAVALPGASVLFSTRIGGVSEGPYESLNIGFLTEDDPVRVERNRTLLAAEAGLDEPRLAFARQVHGSDLHEWDGVKAPERCGALEADTHATAVPELGLLVLVADCLPVALAGDGRVAMLHCGWRGLAAGIVERALETFNRPPAAAVGPGIGRCCYEVGDEVLDAFSDLDGVADGRLLDLRAVAVQKLVAGGVDRIEHVDLCTSCRADLFFSHRRDGGVTGRQGGLAWLTR